ncbi:hypothetical protein MRX96_037738 [Rhipicephalus microplus]
MHSLQFWLFLLLTCLIRIAISSTFSLSDTACFQQLGDKPQDYGLQRLWGTVGWGITAPLSGLLIDYVNAQLGYKSFVPGFYMAVGLMAIQCVIGCSWRLGPSTHNKSILRNVGGLLRKPRHLCFLLDIFVGDLPFMFLSGWLISKLQHINVVRLAFLGFFVKFLGYSFMHNPLVGHCHRATAGTNGVFDCLGIAAGSCLGGLGLSYFRQLITHCSSGEQDKVVVEEPMESVQPFMSAKSNRRDHSDQQPVEQL